MNNNQPVLHLLLYVDCSSFQKRELRKLLSDHTKRIDQLSPAVDINFDSYDEHMEKQFQQEMLYYSTKTLSIQKTLSYEDTPNFRTEDWILLSITHSVDEIDAFNIEWVTGYDSYNDYSSF